MTCLQKKKRENKYIHTPRILPSELRDKPSSSNKIIYQYNNYNPFFQTISNLQKKKAKHSSKLYI